MYTEIKMYGETKTPYIPSFLEKQGVKYEMNQKHFPPIKKVKKR